MTDADDLVRRYLALWQDYLSALLAEPATAAWLRGWAAMGPAPRRERRDPADEREAAAGPPGSPAGAAAAAGPSVERDPILADFARRLARLERRLAAVERDRRESARPRRRPRGARP